MHTRRILRQVLSLGTSGSRAGTASWECALHCPARYPKATAFRRLEQLHFQIIIIMPLTRECRSHTDCRDTRQWRYQNRSCGARAVERLTEYRMRIGVIPTEGPRNNSWPSIVSIPLFTKHMSVSRWSSSTETIFANGYDIGTLWMRYFA
jgi:hypothetical protein